jgi:hypothetical protein
MTVPAGNRVVTTGMNQMVDAVPRHGAQRSAYRDCEPRAHADSRSLRLNVGGATKEAGRDSYGHTPRRSH